MNGMGSCTAIPSIYIMQQSLKENNLQLSKNS